MSRVGERSIMVKKKNGMGNQSTNGFSIQNKQDSESLQSKCFPHIQPCITTTRVFTLEFQFQIQCFFSKHCYIVEPLRGVAPDLEPPNSVGTFDESS